MSKKLIIAHLYPKEMNIYGDMGNILTLQSRCKWRGIETEIIGINIGDELFPEADIYFMGGGQDNDMMKVFDDLKNHKLQIKTMVEDNKVFLLICGGLQLFGKYFIDGNGNKIEGLGILPLVTKAPGNSLEERCLGNIVTLAEKGTLDLINSFYPNSPSKYIVGFENHSGQTHFTDSNLSELGSVVYGKGNNSTQKIEGVRKENIFASYCHGSLLPKNPHFADILIGLAMKNKYENFTLETLDDTIEWRAHFNMLKNLGIS